jgi:arginyl-tRNA--protein-N-Asp/Glu arginylyltransferase
MQHLFEPPAQVVRFYASANYPCSYLEGQTSRSLVATPHHLIDSSVYGMLLARGFRRSGNYTYRPLCEHCNQCVPVRLDVRAFEPNRSQRRARKLLDGMHISIKPAHFDAAHFDLYRRYQAHRHPGSSMDSDDAAQYEQLILEGNVNTQLLVFSSPHPENGTLQPVMVSLIDVVSEGLSAVYTFFDPHNPHGLGTASILWLVEHAQQLGLRYVYLGYWIKDSPKMAYKAKFLPQQRLIDGLWKVA